MSPGQLPSSCFGSALTSLVGLEFLQHQDFICSLFISTTEEWALALAPEEDMYGVTVLLTGSLAETLLPARQGWLGLHCRFNCPTFLQLSHPPLPPKRPKVNHAKRREETPPKGFPKASACGGG